MNNTQLTNFRNYEPEKSLIFTKPESGSIGGSIPKISFKRIRLGTKNPDQTIGDLVLDTPPNLLSFGLQENLDMATGKVNGYSFPVCLWNRNGASDEEKLFVSQFEKIIDVCKKHLVENRELIEKYDLEFNDLKKFSPLYWKMDKGKIVEDRGPMLYIKVIENKKTDKISTLFIDDETNQVMDPLELLNKRCIITGAIKFESIFIGNKISLQLKLSEAVVKVVDTTIRGLLRPVTLAVDQSGNPISTNQTTTTSVTEIQTVQPPPIVVAPPPSEDDEQDDEVYDDDDDQLDDDDEEELVLPVSSVQDVKSLPTTPPQFATSLTSPPPDVTTTTGTSTVSSPLPVIPVPPAPVKRGRGRSKTTV